MDINQTINFLKEKYKELLEIEKKRKFPDNCFLIDIYNKVYELGNMGEKESEILYNLYRSFIKNCINESILVMKATDVKDQNYFNLFQRQIDKINYIIFILNNTFTHLDQFHTRNKKSLIELSFDS